MTTSNGLTVEDDGDTLVVRRQEWMTDDQWKRIREALLEQGWEPARG